MAALTARRTTWAYAIRPTQCDPWWPLRPHRRHRGRYTYRPYVAMLVVLTSPASLSSLPTFREGDTWLDQPPSFLPGRWRRGHHRAHRGRYIYRPYTSMRAMATAARIAYIAGVCDTPLHNVIRCTNHTYHTHIAGDTRIAPTSRCLQCPHRPHRGRYLYCPYTSMPAMIAS
jgi:hypothetical protein